MRTDVLTYPEWKRRRERRAFVAELSLWFFAPAAVLFAICGVLSLDCYATTGPTVSCSADPTQPGCAAPLNDDPVTPLARKDGGR